MKPTVLLLLLSLALCSDTCSAERDSCSSSHLILNLASLQAIPSRADTEIDLSLSSEEISKLETTGEFVYPNDRLKSKDQGNSLYSLYLAYSNKIPYNYSTFDLLETSFSWYLSAKQTFIETIYRETYLDFLNRNIAHAEKLKEKFVKRKYSLDQYKILFITAKHLLIEDEEVFKIPREYQSAVKALLAPFENRILSEIIVFGRRMLVNYSNETNLNFFSRSPKIIKVFQSFTFLSKILMHKERDLETIWTMSYFMTENELKPLYSKLLDMNDFLFELDGEAISLVQFGELGRDAGIDTIKLSDTEKKTLAELLTKLAIKPLTINLFGVFDSYGQEMAEIVEKMMNESVSLFPGRKDIFQIALNHIVDLSSAPYKVINHSDELLYTLYNVTELQDTIKAREEGSNEDYMEFRDGANKFERIEKFRLAIEESVRIDAKGWESRPTLKLVNIVRKYAAKIRCTDNECVARKANEVRVLDLFIKGSQEFLKNRGETFKEKGALNVVFDIDEEIFEEIKLFMQAFAGQCQVFLMELTNVADIKVEEHAFFVNYLKTYARVFSEQIETLNKKNTELSEEEQENLISFQQLHNCYGILCNLITQVFPRNAFTSRIMAGIHSQVSEVNGVGNESIRHMVINKHNKLALKLFKKEDGYEARLTTIKDTFDYYLKGDKNFDTEEIAGFIMKREEGGPEENL